jgi:MoaA/NifB/PqqE/SkfB family radical SAM enzyme
VLLTNGVSIGQRESLLDAIRQSSVEVHVSLDHASPEIDDRVRGGTRATLRGIHSLAEANVPTQVTMVLTARNVTDLESVISLCRENHLALEVNIVSVPERHPLSVLSLSREKREAAARIIREAEDLLSRRDYYSQVRGYLLTGRIARLRRCRAATEGVFIQSDGEILICGQRLHDRVGSILSGSPLDILRNQETELARAPGGPCVSLDCITIA